MAQLSHVIQSLEVTALQRMLTSWEAIVFLFIRPRGQQVLPVRPPQEL
jgi:hypothetical protein